MMRKTCFLSLLAFQLTTVMTTSVHPDTGLLTACNAMRCDVQTACRIVYNPETRQWAPRCIPRRDLQKINEGGCSMPGGALLTLTASHIFSPLRERYTTYRCQQQCPAGFTCNYAGVCCAPEPVADKPGVCPALSSIPCRPASQCTADRDCSGSDKCCPTSCGGNVCTHPARPVPTCARLRCAPGTVCIERPTGPECMKVGLCPLDIMTCNAAPTSNCQDQCQLDEDCPGSQKCCRECPSGCKSCTRALTPFTCSDITCVPGLTCVQFPDGAQCLPNTQSCNLPLDIGACDGVNPRYYFDASGPNPGCRAFNYGGCGGNSNNFRTLQDCVKACGGSHDS